MSVTRCYLLYEYERKGHCSLFICFEPGVGYRQVTVSERRTSADFAREMQQLVGRYPNADVIRVVLDNLNTHTPAALYQTFSAQEARRLTQKLEFLISKKRQLREGTFQQLFSHQKEWVQRKLGDICNIEIGRTPARRKPAYWGKSYKWLSIFDLKTKHVCNSREEITELAASEMKVVRAGTLLMSFKLSIGRLCFAGCDLYTNEAICSFNQPQLTTGTKG